jgi:hypothetical protein
MILPERKMPCRIVKGELFTVRDVWCERCNALPGQLCMTTRYGIKHHSPKQCLTEHRVRDEAFASIAGELLRQKVIRAFPRPRWVPQWAAHLHRFSPTDGRADWVIYRVLTTIVRPTFKLFAPRYDDWGSQ